MPVLSLKTGVALLCVTPIAMASPAANATVCEVSLQDAVFVAVGDVRLHVELVATPFLYIVAVTVAPLLLTP